MYWSKSSCSLVFKDNSAALFGDGSDLQIYHSGNHSFITDSGTGNLYINGSNVSIRGTNGEAGITFNENSAVTILHDNSQKFTTTSTGISITGNISLPSGNLYVADSQKVMLGTSDDLQLFHDGTHSRIYNTTGNISFRSSAYYFNNAAGTENCLDIVQDGAVSLYHNHSKKFETTSTGVTVTGDVGATTGTFGGQVKVTSSNASTVAFSCGDANTGFYNYGTDSIAYSANGTAKWYIASNGNTTYLDDAKIFFGTGFDFRFWHDGNDNFIWGTGNHATIFATNGVERLRITASGLVTNKGTWTNTYAANDTTQCGYQAQNLSDTTNTYAALRLTAGSSSPATAQIASVRTGTGQNDLTFQLETGNAAFEALRITSNGITGINTTDGRFNNSNSASSNKFYQNDMKLGLHGSIAIGNLSSTATDVRELAFYRRGGPAPGTAISNHHMGRIAWYGSSNDSAFPDMAWSIECNPNGSGWTAGSNRHGYLSFISGRNGQYMRLNSNGYLGVGHAGDPSTRLHVQGNSDGGAASATLTIEDSDSTADSKEPILAFDGAGTRQARIMSSDQTSTGAGGLSFGIGSSNATALQLTAQRYTKIHTDTRDWATVEYKNLRTHCRMHYSPGNAVQTYTILRIRRHWWGWGNYKIRCKAIYYNSSLESTWYVNGHGSGGNNYSIAQETFGGDAMNNSWGCTVTHTASNNSPGSSGTWYADIKVNIPNYYYVTIWVEAWGSSYTTDPTTGVANSINTYCLM